MRLFVALTWTKDEQLFGWSNAEVEVSREPVSLKDIQALEAGLRAAEKYAGCAVVITGWQVFPDGP